MSLDGDTQEVYERQRPGRVARQGACRLPRRARGGPAARNHVRADPAQHPRGRGGHRAGARARRVPVQHRPADAHRDRRAVVGEARADGRAIPRLPPRCSRGWPRASRASWSSATSRSTSRRGSRESLATPPATLLVLPNGWVKVAAALPHICADLRRDRLAEAWEAYRNAWRSDTVLASARCAISDPTRHARANTWQLMSVANV